MPLRLITIAGDCVPPQLVLDAPVVIGRDPVGDLRLVDDRASRFHARIEPDGAGWKLVDQGSANGSVVDGARVGEAPLRDGTMISLGGVQLTVTDEDAQGATRVVTDSGASLAVTAERETRRWHEDDGADALAPAHRCLRAVHDAAPGRAAEALAAALVRELGCTQAAVVVRGRASCAGMDPRLALRLAQGRRARLLRLGRELVGQTVAQARIGSALSAPLGDSGHLVAARDAEDEAPGQRELALIAAIAAEVADGLRPDDDHADLVGDSEAMQRLRARIARVAATDATVLVSGESGTGKELVARALHRYSGRAGGPFVAVNCSSATNAAPTPAPKPPVPAASAPPTAEPCSSTRSANCPRRCRPSCCACSRRVWSSRWAATRSRSTCGWWRRPTAISRPRSTPDASARICSTAST